jgi:hypothetical protein
MEENLFCRIPQREKPLLLYPTTEEIYSIAGYNGRKPVALWDTMRKIFLHCIPKFFCVVFFTKKKLFSVVGYSAEKASVKWDTVHCIRFCCGVGYNGRKILALWDTTEKNLLAIQRLFSVVSHNRKNLFLCVPQRRKTFSVVSLNGKKHFLCIPQRKKPLPLYPKTAKKL